MKQILSAMVRVFCACMLVRHDIAHYLFDCFRRRSEIRWHARVIYASHAANQLGWDGIICSDCPTYRAIAPPSKMAPPLATQADACRFADGRVFMHTGLCVDCHLAGKNI